NMAGTVEQKLAAQGVVLHEPASPVANYVGFVRTGNLLFVSGQVCFDANGKLIAKGKLGAGVSVEQGNAAARGCGINLLSQIKAALGDLDKVVRVVRLGGFVNSAPDFLEGPKVLNGASDLMVAAFGDKGRHARTTDGEAMVHHDDTLGRLTEGSGALLEKSAAELRAVKFKDTSERMMSLGDLCELVNGRVPLVIEVKSHFDGDRKLVKRMAEVLA